MRVYFPQDMELPASSAGVRRLGWVALVTAAAILLVLTAAVTTTSSHTGPVCADGMIPCSNYIADWQYCFSRTSLLHPLPVAMHPVEVSGLSLSGFRTLLALSCTPCKSQLYTMQIRSSGLRNS